MRKSVIALSALVSLALSSAASAQSHQTFNGFFVGGVLGATNQGPSATLNDDKVELITASVSNAGAAGVQAGYNYQMNKLVLGVVGDWLWMDQSATTINNENDFVSTRFKDLGSLRFRAGFTPVDNLLLFGTIGEGWTRYSADINDNGELRKSISENASGLAYGGGAALMLSPNSFVQAEYVHYNFNVNNGPGPFDSDSTSFNSLGGVDTVRVSVNFKTNN